ncbi:MAG: hypothetical protein K2N68_02980, partial [Clostridia bacterium]|nr:hypothetical protein [Clostridia bacterium]
MGKVKSAIITALFVAAVAVLAFFATVSFGLPGGVDTYNSFVANIHLGADLTGNAYATLYPEGVISTADYQLVANDEENSDSEVYAEKYLERGGAYVSKDKLGYTYVDGNYVEPAEGDKTESEFKASIKRDAEVLLKRLGDKGYSSYSVLVGDEGFSIKVSLPTNFSYVEYKESQNTYSSDNLADQISAINVLSYSGKIDLRDKNTYKDSKSLISIGSEFKTYFSGASALTRGGSSWILINLNDDGFKKLNDALDSYGGSETTAYFYIGETCLGLSVTIADGIADKTLAFQPSNMSASAVQDVAILLNSAIAGDEISNVYNDEAENSGTNVIATTSKFGAYAPVYLFAALIAIVVAAIIGPSVKYKKLGLVNALSVLIYALAMVTAIMLIDIQVTLAGAFAAILGLALLLFSNIVSFEAIRKETLTGRTIQASVKLGYKKTVFAVLDIHVLLLVIAVMLALIGVGEVAAFGFISLIGVIGSYVLHW